MAARFISGFVKRINIHLPGYSILFGLFAFILSALFLYPYLMAYHLRAEGYENLNKIYSGQQSVAFDPMHYSGNERLISSGDITLLEKAISLLESSVDLHPEASRSYLLLGRAYYIAGDLEQAVEAYTQYSLLRPENPLGFLESGFALESLCQADEDSQKQTPAALRPGCTDENLSQDIRTSWAKAGIRAEDFLRAGDSFTRAAAYEEAIVWYSRANLMAPTSGYPWYKMGQVYKAISDPESSILLFIKAVQLSPDLREPWYELGKAYLSNGELKHAIEAVDFGMSGKTGTVGASNFLYLRGRSLQDLEGADNGPMMALEAYHEATELNDFSVDFWQKSDAYFRKGKILVDEGRTAEAVGELEAALAANPNHYAALITGAGVYLENGETDRALQLGLRAIEIEPKNPNAYYIVGEIYTLLSRKDAAIGMYEQILTLDPGSKIAQNALSRLLQDADPQ